MSMTDTSCSLKSPAISAKPRTVSVNGVEIAREEISRETQNQPAATPIEAWKKAARALAIRELLLQEAKRLGIVGAVQSDEEGRRETEDEAALRTLVETQVLTPSADELACERYYAANTHKFRVGDLFHVAHILLPAKPDDAAARAAAQSRAEAILATLKQQPESFGALALEFSACPSRGAGGSLGEIAIGDTVPEFESALRRMNAGAVHPAPVATRYGIHVIRLDRHIEGKTMPYEMVRGRIAAYLDAHVQHRALAQYVQVLASRAVVTGIDFPDVDGPLVQ